MEIIFFIQTLFSPCVVQAPHRQGPCQPWDGLWDGRGMDSTRPPTGRSNLSAHEDEVQLGWDTGSSTLWVWKKGFLFPVPFSGGNLLNW